MIEINIPKDISKFEDDFILGLSVRKFCASFISVVMSAFLIYASYKYSVNTTVMDILKVIATIPLFFGFFKFNEMTFEIFIKNIFKSIFIGQRRLYKTEVIYG